MRPRLGALAVLGILLAASLSGSAGIAAAQTTYQRVMAELAETLRACRGLARRMLPYDVVFRRDPMQPLVDSAGQLVSSAGLRGGLWAQGIIWSDTKPLAIVDDALLGEGESVGPYTILDIQPDGLQVQRDGEAPLFIPLDRGYDYPTSSPESSS